MKHIILLFTFVFLSVQFSFAQSESNSKIDTLTTEDNLKWLEEFKKIENKAEKIQAIKDKIVLDSAYKFYLHNRNCCGLVRRIVDTTKNSMNENSSISLVLKSESKLLFVLNNYPLEDKQNKTHQLLLLLNQNTVSEINIIEGAAARAIWGSRGMNGVILMTVKDRKTRKKIKQIQKEQTQKKH